MGSKISQKKKKKLKDTLHLIVELCDQNPLTEMKLWKLLFFADLEHYKEYGKTITGIDYIRNTHGPTPDYNAALKAVEELEDGDRLKVIPVKGRRMYKNISDVSNHNLDSSEVETIVNVCRSFGRHNAVVLRQLSHLNSVYYSAKKEKGTLNFNYIYYQDDEDSDAFTSTENARKSYVEISSSAKKRLLDLIEG